MKLQNISAAIGSSILLLTAASPAFATDQNPVRMFGTDPVTVTASSSTTVNLGPLITSADTKIDARISALNELMARINQIQKISSTEKSTLDSFLQTAINQMTTLKAKIDADTDVVTLKTDIQSITKSYRDYVLVLPQGRIVSAADRIMAIAGQLTFLSAKLQLRISAAQTSGKDVTSLNTSLSDMNSKTSDANTQAQAAINEVLALKPDNGNASIYASNQTSLKDARTKIKTAMTDLQTARKDAGTIVRTLQSWDVSASGSATSSTETDR